jgi:hypothetical protein
MTDIPSKPEPNHRTVSCFKCDKELQLESFKNDEGVEISIMGPYGGVDCEATGNYGSTVFDPANATGLRFYLCDECLIKNRKRFELTTWWSQMMTTYASWEEDD